MRHLKDNMLNEVLESMPTDFDSHNYINEVTRQFPQSYAHELDEYAFNNNDPFLVLHPLIARKLAANPRVTKVTKAHSLNIRGRRTKNQTWRKTN